MRKACTATSKKKLNINGGNMKLSYEDYKRIQTMKAAGYNGNQVSIKLGYTQYAVYKVWDMSEAQFLSVKQTRCDSLDKYRQFVVETLRSQPLLTSSQVLDKIKENFNEDIPASLPTFYRFMRLLRQNKPGNPYGNNIVS